jgi:iron complex outermembrane receptor protein
MNSKTRTDSALVLMTLLAASATALAAPPDRSAANQSISAQPLDQALAFFARESGLQIIYLSQVANGIWTRGAPKNLPPRETLRRLLQGTGLTFKFTNSTTVTIMKTQPADSAAGAAADEAAKGANRSSYAPLQVDQVNRVPRRRTVPDPKRHRYSANGVAKLQEVIVTGSHIRGAPSTSRLIKITQRQMIEAGQTNLGEVIRSLTMNFNGGQNPGVAQGASGSNISNQNITGASSVNLRGLGPDATLTLLNGRRLSYDSFTQAVDISAIPLAAVDSIEIDPDGASAIYGSDAVAGVVNVILKKDYDGVATSVRYGNTTAGGDQQQEYSAVGGARWSSGGFLLAYDYEDDTGIRTIQRYYTRSMPAGDIYPGLRHDDALLTLHQHLTDTVTFSLDALYNRHWDSTDFPPAPASPVQYTESPITDSYVVSPTLSVRLPSAWRATLNVTSGGDHSHYDENSILLSGGGLATHTAGCYCNSLDSAEMDADGPLLRLSAGEARMALGAGYRKVVLKDYSFTSPVHTSGSRASYYAFGELFLPLVSPPENMPLVHRLSVDAAVRYEDYYEDFGPVTTPKLGLLYAPSADLRLKASWGESFKTPTLLQEQEETHVFLWPAGLLGASGYPASATALMAYGGNRNLDAERARTWSATMIAHPSSLPAFQADLTYFSIKYRDRVLQPVSNFFAALSDPAYREFVNSNPSAAQQQALITLSSSGITNFAGVPYDPSNVIATIDDLYTNAARQYIHGIDLTSNYHLRVRDGLVRLSGEASWLTSDQQDSALSPALDLAGTIYNPPHFRSRAGITWEGAQLSLSAFLNYIGHLTEDRGVTSVTDASMTTLDLSALYRVSSTPPLLHDLQLSLSLHNLTDVSPPYLRPPSPNIVPYDSTNYSPLGRVVSVSIGKRW